MYGPAPRTSPACPDGHAPRCPITVGSPFETGQRTHEWPVTAGTDRPVAIGTRTVDNWTAKPSTETGPRRWGPGYTAISAPNVGSCSRGATPESGGDCPDEARKRAVGPTWIARRWGSPSVSGAAQGIPSAISTLTARQNAGSPSAPNGCAMTALRPPRRGACRAVSFTSASASLAPTVGQRATPVHDRAGAQDRTQLLPQEDQR